MGRPQENFLVRSARFPAQDSIPPPGRFLQCVRTPKRPRSLLEGRAIPPALYNTHKRVLLWCCVHDARVELRRNMRTPPVFALATSGWRCRPHTMHAESPGLAGRCGLIHHLVSSLVIGAPLLSRWCCRRVSRQHLGVATSSSGSRRALLHGRRGYSTGTLAQCATCARGGSGDSVRAHRRWAARQAFRHKNPGVGP